MKIYCLSLLVLTAILFAQTKDTLNAAIQFHTINENLNLGYKKHKTVDMFRFIPKDIAALGKFAIQKENLKWDALAVGSKLAIIPFDQKITEVADDLGASVCKWNGKNHS